jgi:hypothetical protein
VEVLLELFEAVIKGVKRGAGAIGKGEIAAQATDFSEQNAGRIVFPESSSKSDW